ncbi:uncharacterized protein LOC113517233 [Galleria mellonella]|uniref:Uncharacterized protein LOC113517233 n=1 Tax=Galleria mellonella TaxID=7137 RepID=A0A6J1WXE8_GALME|nr:uncharacterized protein LOC113517233 [Galleria mellonella]
MGNMKSKKSKKEPENLFERERWNEHLREHKIKVKSNPGNRRPGVIEQPVVPSGMAPSQLAAPPIPPPAHIRSYDDEALDNMRRQLRYDINAFLLNNILLSVQFFDNYERELDHLHTNTVDREHMINEAMVQHHKHVFFADRLQECLHEFVRYQGKQGQNEPLLPHRLFVIYDNIEASEPGDTSDYSAVLDAPFYKLCMQDTKEPGFVKLKKLEVLGSTYTKETEKNTENTIDSDDTVYTDSERESNASDDFPPSLKGEELLESIRNRLNENSTEINLILNNANVSTRMINVSDRRFSGPIKKVSLQVQKSNISNVKNFRKVNTTIGEDINNRNQNRSKTDTKETFYEGEKSKKPLLKNNTRGLSGPTKDEQSKLPHIDNISEDTETSGYRSTSNSSRLNELSETESDYGYSTITESSTPKRIELSVRTNSSLISGTLPEDAWISIYTRADHWSEEEEEENIENLESRISEAHLYETHYYLNSVRFMRNFVDIFITDLGISLGLSQEVVKNALTQGASIYCDTVLNGKDIRFEVYPALIAAWPNAANQWVIRERKIIQNPRTNLSYQWPTKQMVHKTIDFGCFLVPIGYRPKRGLNPDQQLQWKLIFPAAERFLEKCLAHSHIRCYLFALVLYRTFLEVETSKVGIDASHIKNHLFWQCEDNFAKWPEDRPGESLRLFLETFYVHMCQKRLPNYFMNNCNEFKSIPRPLLMRLQRILKNILESPVPYVLCAIDKLKYVKTEFYPKLNCHRLYAILTSKNPLRVINPSITTTVPLTSKDVSDSDDENEQNVQENAKAQDKPYRWKKEKLRRLEERKKVLYNKHKTATKQRREINPNVILPAKMEMERRRLVLEFFIPHFIAMSRSSEKFEAIGQAIIYLEQAQRLCLLLLEEPGGDITANEYMDVIRDKLADCQRKLANQVGYKLSMRRESNADRPLPKAIKKRRPKFDNINGNNSPTETPGITPFSFIHAADIHVDHKSCTHVQLTDMVIEEESRL